MPWVVLAAIFAVLAVAAAVVVLALRAGYERRSTGDVSAPVVRLEPEELAALDEASVDLDTVMAGVGVAMYIPVDGDRRFLALASEGTELDGRSSSAVPSQLAAVAVAGQAGVEAMVKAGQISGRLVLVDPATARALKTGSMVKDRAGETLAIIRGAKGFGGITRIKPLSEGLVKSAAAGPAMLSAIAMQAQLAEVEKSISEVRDAVNAVRGYLDAAERAAVEGRRETIATVYRTATDAGEMTQSLWDQIQGLESDLRRDVRMADGNLAEQARVLANGASGLVGSRLEWLERAATPLSSAVAGVADARRTLIQFSMLRLWWLAVTDDPTLASRQDQLRELLEELPTHQDEQDRVSAALRAAGDLRRHHRVLAPRKHKQVGTKVASELDALGQLPWKIVDVRRAAELER